MPDIAVAANIPAAKATPAASDGPSASAADAASGPFSAVLQRQMDGAEPATANAAAPDAASAAPSGADLAALLPLLMGSAAMAGEAPAAPATPAARKPTAGGAEADAANAIMLAAPVAAPVVGANAPTAAPTASDASAAGTSTSTATTLAPATANLAAAPDSAGADAKPAAKDDQTFAALMGDNARSVAPAPTHVAAAAVDTAAAGRGHVVESPVGSPAWDTEVGNRLVWMANNQSSRAELVLTPPQLGKIEISVTLSGDQATATFVSASPAVRDAIESAIPRLREVLADAGVTLGQTQVGSDAPKQGSDQFRDNSFAGPALSSDGMRVSTSGAAAWSGAGRGLVDVFA